jgi:hypothetical protein
MVRGTPPPRRRRLLVSALVLVGIAGVALAMAVFTGGGGTPAAAAVPFHPLVGTFLPDDTRLQGCRDVGCFNQAFGNIAYYEGPQAAFALVRKLYDDGASPACHRIAHFIGAAALERNGGDISHTFAQGSPVCWSGYYHGVLERTLVNTKSYEPKVLAKAARPLCRGAVTRATTWVAYQCLHGLGHGLMVATGLDLPRSLAVCRRLDSAWDADACRGGVFMENIQSPFGFRSRWLRDDDPVYPCNAVAKVDKFRCYQMVTSRILPAVDDDWARAAEMCSQVERDFVSTCFQSLGRDASSRTDRVPEETMRVCAEARSYGGEGDCIVAAAMDVVSNHASGDRAADLCGGVRKALWARCFFGVGAAMGPFRKTRAAREADCVRVAPSRALVGMCLAGARSSLPPS